MTDRVRAMIFNESREFLVLFREMKIGRVLLLPGGGLEPGESDLFALEREMKEEIGIDLSSLVPLKIAPYTGSDKRLGVLKFFFFTLKEGVEVFNMETTKTSALKWCSYDVYLRLCLEGCVMGAEVDSAYDYLLRMTER